MADFNAKKKLFDAAASVCRARGLRAELRFQWNLTDAALRIAERERGLLTLIPNLRLLAGPLSAAYLEAQVRLAADVRTRLPQSYAEGLAFLGRIADLETREVFACGKPVDPACLTSRRRPRGLGIEDLVCTEAARGTADGSVTLCRLTELPEIVFGRDRLPRCAALCAVHRVLRSLRAGNAGEYPVLSALPRDGDGKPALASPEALFRAYAETGSPFFGGLGTRMLAYGSGEEAEKILLSEEIRETAARCAGEYVGICWDQALADPDPAPCALTDDRIAADRTVRRLRRIFGENLPGTDGGSVHPVRGRTE